MKVKEKIMSFLGFRNAAAQTSKKDYIGPDVAKALERNEMASVRAREALEEVLSRNDRSGMANTFGSIVRKM